MGRIDKQTKIRFLLILLAVLAVVLLGVLTFGVLNAKYETNVRQTVTVMDGVAIPSQVTTTIKVDKKGKYNWYTSWKESEYPNFVTGMVLFDSDGRQIFGASGTLADIQFWEQQMEAGTYTAVYTFITDAGQYEDYITKYSLEKYSMDYDDYADGSWKMTYTLGYAGDSGTAYALGVVCGVLFALAFGLLMLLAARKKGEDASPAEYDERQLAARGIAFKYGFFTLLSANFVMMFCGVAGVEVPIEQDISYMACVLLGIVVFLTYSILKDAYFSLNENRKILMVLFAVITAVNLYSGFYNFKNGSAIVDGKLTMEGTQLLIGAMFVYMFVLMLVKGILDRREEDE